jgi:RNA polymerase sigma-70 factor (ECF subfamily)
MNEVITDPTSVSLLNRLQHPATPNSEEAWQRFVKLYTPLLFLWAERVGASHEEAADLVQEVFLVLAREMPAFRHDPGQRFRGWLWTVLLNKWRDRARQRAAQPAVAGTEELETVISPDHAEQLADEEYRAYLLERALDLMRAELPDAEWRACTEYLVKGRPASEVAREGGLSVNQVYLIKSRILRRLRAELEGLLD